MSLEADAKRRLTELPIESAAALEAIRVALIGRESGRLNDLMALLSRLPKDERREAGQSANKLKLDIESWLDRARTLLRESEATEVPELDLTLPARATWRGGRHPVTVVIEEIIAIFRQLGFTVARGPEAESSWYNFDALNFPADHPALDLHDTLYLDGGALLRTHTSPVQVRTLQRFPPPVRVLVPGNVYRRDIFDASHAPMFAQIEGLSVDAGVSFVDLKGTLTHFASRFFGATHTRFRPSFFPFTEPSAEMDVECQICHGAGCATCKHTGWAEILGCGMVHPAVLSAAGLDAERYTGWAFGMGPARIAMQRYGVPDIRELYDSDVRTLGALAP
jgi:phenylalanyl-tRNA synthetase alpha chain